MKKNTKVWAGKKILFKSAVFLFCIFLFSACGAEKEVSNIALSPDIQMQESSQKAVFSFSEKETLLLPAKEKKSVKILLTSHYDSVQSANISFRYNPEFLSLAEYLPTEKSILFANENNEEKGFFSATLAFPDGILGENIPVFSFDLVSKGEKIGESSILFDSSHLSALLADVKNTDIAKKTEPSSLVVSVLP